MRKLQQIRNLKGFIKIRDFAKKGILLFIFIFTSFFVNVYCQDLSLGTPSGYEKGIKMSDQNGVIDNVNLFNGNLTISVPIMGLTGRGDLSASINFIPTSPTWAVDKNVDEINRTYYTPIPDVKNHQIAPQFYHPAEVRTQLASTRACPSNSNQSGFGIALTLLKFVTPDGGEHTLRDQIHNGEPVETVFHTDGSGGANRGATFKSADNSNIVFVSDTAIYDHCANGIDQYYGPTGYLYMKDGTQYRVVNGRIETSRDRNGNFITYTYGNDISNSRNYRKLLSIKDSMGRTVNISNTDIQFPSDTQLYDEISYYGSNGQSRSIKINYCLLSQALRPGYFTSTYKTLFPSLNNARDDVYYDPYVPQSIVLPNGQLYKLFYNPYREIARVEVPGGGAFEYDYTPTDQSVINQFGGKIVHRRVIERRTYDNLNSSVPLQIQTFTKDSLTLPDSSAATMSTVEYLSPNRQPLSSEKHYFKGTGSDHRLNGLPACYKTWSDGLEFQTDFLDEIGNIIRSTKMTYVQREHVSWWVPIAGQTNRTTANEPENDTRLVERIDILTDANLFKTTKFDYSNDPFNNLTDVYEYDYVAVGQSEQFLRRTHYDYVTDSNYTSYTAGAYLLSLPSQNWISSDYDGQVKSSLTKFVYDNYNQDPNQIESKNAALEPRMNVVGHDTATYGANKTNRGNITKIRTFGKAQNQTEEVDVYSNYDILGNVLKTYDARGISSEIDYADRFGIPNEEARSNTSPDELKPIGSQPQMFTFAFPTKVTNSLGWTYYTQFDYYTGLFVNTENINGVINKTIYDDPLDRPKIVVANVGTALEKQTTFQYNDVSHILTTTSDLNHLNDNALKSEIYYDGLGNKIETRKYESDSSYIAVKTTPFIVLQDPETLQQRGGTQTTNPYRSNSGEPIVWTKKLGDALGRVIKLIGPDDSVIKTEYNGNSVTQIDQAGKPIRNIVNGLGQLTRVDEPDNNGNLGALNNPIQPTEYKYNALGNLVKVKQGVQNRYFLYDSLGRLLRVRQPEQDLNSELNTTEMIDNNNQWTEGFSYDENGNVLTARDANNVTVTNVYDNLNRILTKSYSDGITPSVSFKYDGLLTQINTVECPGTTINTPTSVPNSKGLLTEIKNNVSVSQYTNFDIAGRTKTSRQITECKEYKSEYQYNFSGVLTEETYPSGRVVKTTLQTNGDVSAISSRTATGDFKTYASNFSYTPAGGISKMMLGNGRWETAIFNNRLQIEELGLGNSSNDTSLWKVNYQYAEQGVNGTVNTGNITKQTLNFAGLVNPIVQEYKYDTLDRLTEAKETSNNNQNWIQTIEYDRYGNRTSFSQNIGGVINNQTPSIDVNKNRFDSNQGFLYDKNGNITDDSDPITSQPRKFIFNGANKQTEVKDVNGVTIGKYFYDGEGKRIKKITNSETTIFVYSGGKLVAEYSTQIAQTPSTKYLTEDNLGTPRVITDKRGAVVIRRDFMPFGEELFAGERGTNPEYSASSDNVRQKFTGYLKDDETQLDFAGARYYNNKYGKFSAVDPLLASGKSANPQSFNRYVFVGNNPITRVDLNGMDWIQSKTKDKNGLYTFRDVYGKELKSLLGSGDWALVDFQGNESSDLYLNDVPIYRMFAEGGGMALVKEDDESNSGVVAPAAVDTTDRRFNDLKGPPNEWVETELGWTWYDENGLCRLDVHYHDEKAGNPHYHWWDWETGQNPTRETAPIPDWWHWDREDEDGRKNWNPFWFQGIEWDLFGRPLEVVVPGQPTIYPGAIPIDSPPVPMDFPIMTPPVPGTSFPQGSPVINPGTTSPAVAPTLLRPLFAG